MRVPIEVDIPCDPTQIDQTGMPWTFLDEAAHPERIVEAIAALATNPGDPLEYVEAMRRSHLLTA
jgi:hypothetical protein